MDEKGVTSSFAKPRDSYSGETTERAFSVSHNERLGDKALQLVGERDGPIVIDEATNRRLLRKIDLVMMPIMCVIYGLNYLDKTALSYASITGLRTDIGLVNDNYQWLGSIFYFGYLGFEYVAVQLLQRLPLAKYSGFCVIAWGLTLSCFAAVHNFAGAVVIRLLLGIFEASVSPGWALFTSQWYTKEEQGFRTAWWFSFNGFAQVFGGAVAYGIAHGAEVHGFTIAPWKIIYLVLGCFTIVVGIVFVIVIPDSQLNAWWLSKEDRVLAVERVRVNQQGIGNKIFKPYQLKEALTDPMTWAFFIYALTSDIPNGGLSNFFSILIESFGYTAQESLIYGMITGALEVVAIIGWATLADYTGIRVLTSIPFLLISLLGSSLLYGLPLANTTGRLAGYYMTIFYVASFVSLLSLLATNVAGYTKKTTVAGIYFIGYCIGNIIGPQTFRPKEEPYYTSAKATMVACFAIGVVDMLFIHFWYVRRNKQKKVQREAPGYQKVANQEFLDLTDYENPEFVYAL